ncbi:MAG: hypothetical protein IKP50_04480 [Bacilli bacterium]|nr:hypothetical protein [Bacilli bacterium]
MIVIVGDTHDDVLYFETVLANKKQEIILDLFKIQTGTIFSQEALVIRDMSTNVLASSVLTYLIQTRIVDLVICVGKCISISDSLKPGDVAVSTKVIDANVDLSMFKDVGMAQIPGFSREFKVQDNLFSYLAENLEKRVRIDFNGVTYLSSDNMSKDMIEFLKKHKTMFAEDEEKFVLDHNSAGVALAATLNGVPFICAKVIEYGIDHSENLKTYANVLTRYIDLGKGVIQTINNIGRSDIQERTAYEQY